MPDVKMNYGSMESMEKAFHQAQQQVQDSITQMEKVAKSLEDGALLGSAGDAFKDAIRSKLEKGMKTIADQMGGLEKDINGALIATRDGVSTAQSRFK
jgi:uncharacterized protein YukE